MVVSSQKSTPNEWSNVRSEMQIEMAKSSFENSRLCAETFNFWSRNLYKNKSKQKMHRADDPYDRDGSKPNQANQPRPSHTKTMKDLLDKISDFVLPVESHNATQDSPAKWLDKILAEKLKKHSDKSGKIMGKIGIYFNFLILKVEFQFLLLSSKTFRRAFPPV